MFLIISHLYTIYYIVYKIIYTFFEIYNKSIISNRDGKILARDRLGGWFDTMIHKKNTRISFESNLNSFIIIVSVFEEIIIYLYIYIYFE